MTRFQRLAAHLRLQRPQWNRRLVVRCVPMKDDGSCNISDSDRTITISVNSKLNWSQQKDTLLHEFAHAEELDRWQQHGPVWGKFHSQYYQAWEAWEE